MATKLLHLLPIFSLLLFTTVVSARPGRPFHPCNTLIISTYSFSLHPQNPENPSNPDTFPFNGDFLFHDHRPLRHLPRHPRLFLFPSPGSTEFLPRPDRIELDRSEMTDLPLVGLSSFKDILSVVASLLFGAACGALTAGTMYLIWSLLTYRSGYYRSLEGFTSDSDDDNDDDDIFNPKKSHQNYVPIPASPVKEKVKDAADVAKETV